MRKTAKYISIILSIALLASCSGQLDLKPYQSIDAQQALATTNDIQVALVGAYHDLGAEDFMRGETTLEADLIGDNGDIRWQGTYVELTEITDKLIPVNNNFITNNWLYGYAVINDVNNILAALDKADTASHDRIEGEALFIRSTAYFELIRLFAKDYNDGDAASNAGIPLVLTPTTEVDSSSYVKRNTVKEVYAQIISDLKTAEGELPEENDFYANSTAASAMLSRVYMQQGDYQNALTEANKVINSGLYQLTPTYAAEFPNPGQVHVDNTTEDIFALQVTPTSGINALNEFYASGDFGGRGDALITQQHLNHYESGDDRLNLFTLGGSNYTDKFDNTYGNVHIIRLAEMYLNRAECNFRLGSSVGATPVQDINTIRKRAKLSTKTSVSLADILHERYLELAFENGFFLYDKKRLKESVGALPYNSPKLVFPIPEREIIANPNLTQNKGYN